MEVTLSELYGRLEHIKQIRAERARTSFIDFIDYIWDNQYEWNWHHKEIAQKLQDFYDGKIMRMMVFAAPRMGKTELVARMFPSWVLGRNPDDHLISCSHTAHFANTITKDVIRIMRMDLYRDIFPDSYLRVEGQARVENRLTASGFDIPGGQGSYSSAGAGGNIVGKGANFLILDDVIKSAEHAGSQAQRNKLNEWYGRDALTRLEKDGKVLIINTRQHELDICGHLLDKSEREEHADKWEVLTFPAIDAKGNALWPAKFSMNDLLSIKAELSSMAWASLYQQTPTAQEGTIFKRAWFVRYSDVDLSKAAVNFTIDSAYTKDERNDATAIMAYVKIGSVMYVKHCVSVRMEFPELLKFIKQFVKDNGYTHASRIYIEPKASGLSIIQQMKVETGLNIVKDKAPKDSKEVRAHSITAKIESGKVMFPSYGTWVDELIDECCGFPNAKHDDRLDTLMMAIRLSFRPSALRMRGRSA